VLRAGQSAQHLNPGFIGTEHFLDELMRAHPLKLRAVNDLAILIH